MVRHYSWTTANAQEANLINWHSLLQDAAAIATAAGVLVAARQLYLAKGQATSQFEDSLNEHDRALLVEIPLPSLLGQRMREDELAHYLPAFYRYFDLSNEQAFLHAQGRIRPATWTTWRDGILQNMARPAFRQAWEQLLPDLDGSFDDLKALLASAQTRGDA